MYQPVDKNSDWIAGLVKLAFSLSWMLPYVFASMHTACTVCLNDVFTLVRSQTQGQLITECHAWLAPLTALVPVNPVANCNSCQCCTFPCWM